MLVGTIKRDSHTRGDEADVEYRIGDKTPPPELVDFSSLAARAADVPIKTPKSLPAQVPRSTEERFAASSVYPYLETNIDFLPMQFTQEPIPGKASELSISLHGKDSPFRHWKLMRQYIESLVHRRGYQDFVAYNTTVERAEKVGNEWKVTLRRPGETTDYWWVEWFDAVVVASGHYSVPYVPHIKGLEEFSKRNPGAVIHSKQFRGRDAFRNKVGSVSLCVGTQGIIHETDIPY